MTCGFAFAGRGKAVGAVAPLATLAIMLVLAGCGGQPVRPQTYDPGDTASWFSGSATPGVSELYKADYEEGRSAYAQGDYVTALNRYGRLAEKGVPEAAYELGKAYRYGNGAPENPELAAQWLIAAVSQPNSRRPHASYHLGTLFLEGEGVPRDPELARRLLQQAVENGYPRAGLPLARIYAAGLGVQQDVTRAHDLALQSAESGDIESYLWLLRGYQADGILGADPQSASRLAAEVTAKLRQRIAEQQEPRAMRDLALIHYQGLGVPSDQGTAIRLLERAAQLGHPEYLGSFGEALMKGEEGFDRAPQEGLRLLRLSASRYWYPEGMSLIAEAYRDGLGTRRDPVEAENWFRRAVEAGSDRAALEYGRMLVAREGDPEALQRGVTLLERAAQQDMPYAWSTLGALHMEQAFPGADPAKGFDYLRRAHEAGVASATSELGQAYLEGRGVNRDPDKAVMLLERAAGQGQAGAMATLGQAYLEGDVLPRRPELAKEWLTKAEEAGVESARFRLGRALLSGEIAGDAAKGLRIVAGYAQSGNTLAMMDLGRAMRDGKTVPRDEAAARQWFENAAAAGEPDAEAALASMLYGAAGDEVVDLAKLEEAARLGHAGAMSRLGRAYLEGAGVPANPTKGRVWLSRAAGAGNTSAAQSLGSAYLHGDHGLERDPVEGRRLLEMAVAARDVNAERDLGYALIEPRESGLPANLESGLRLLTLAARKGDRYAMELLGRSYLDGTSVMPPQPENAKVWLELAADHGDVSAMTALGSGYLDGTLPGGDRKRGIRYLERSAARGDDTARTKLGNAYLFGAHGLPVQLEKGTELLQTAADNGHAGAMAALGRAYLDGTLGERRLAEGARLLYLAARTGHPTARYVLAEAYLESQGLESANRDYAQAWLDTVVAGDTDAAVATLTEMLREAPVAQPDAGGERTNQGAKVRP